MEKMHQNLNIVCLRTGEKYSPDYVSKLYTMVKRNLNIPFDFHCFVDRQFESDLPIKQKIIPTELMQPGWWNKLLLFKKRFHNLEGEILYLDLDIVIIGNLYRYIDFEPGYFCIIKDFSKTRKNYYNSSIMKFPSGRYDFVWYDYISKSGEIQGKMQSDQDWITLVLKDHQDFRIFPDSWQWSYKWEVKPEKAIISVFHGEPKPHQCKEPWVLENWK
jgi:hypothetical protein